MTRTRQRITPGDGDVRHGTPNGYQNLGCRCVPCTGAWADYFYKLSQRERAPLPSGDPRHGTSSAFRWWKCSCRICLDGEAARARARRRRTA